MSRSKWKGTYTNSAICWCKDGDRFRCKATVLKLYVKIKILITCFSDG